MSEQQAAVDNRIPVNIITGFLGSGKTTLLNHWVNSEKFKDTLVLINEFGDVGLDHELVQAVDDTVVLLGSGCICCTLQGELVNSLAINLAKSKQGAIPKFDRVLIETTGLADPAGVISTLINDEFCLDNYYYAGTVTVVDGQFAREQLQKQYEAVKQVALADIILISKGDLIDADELDSIREVVHGINPAAPIHAVVKGNITPDVMEEIGPYQTTTQKEEISTTEKRLDNWLSIKPVMAPAKSGITLASPLRPVTTSIEAGVAKPKIIAHTNIDSFAITRDEPINPMVFLSAVNVVQQQYGDSLLRIKGILDVEGQDRPVIIHGVQGQFYPITQLDAWPQGKKESKIVMICRATVLEQIKHMFLDALANPDEAALDYYRQLLEAAEIASDSMSEDDGVEEIVLYDRSKEDK